MGRRNVGKSSLLNQLAQQPVSIVSPVAGTTTDPVKKTMELLPLGPVIFIDTAGLDDDQLTLGSLRAERARLELRQADLVLVVSDPTTRFGVLECDLIARLREAGTAFFGVINQIDTASEVLANPTAFATALSNQIKAPVFAVSAQDNLGIEALKEAIAHAQLNEPVSQRLIGDHLKTGDTVVLVVPIDSAAPKGRLILPQQQTIRDILESGATAIMTQVPQLAQTLQNLQKPPRFVITDSQVFAAVRALVPEAIPLTSFSILFARYKGDFNVLQAGLNALEQLKENDKILIVEGCTHRRQCGDIGSVKIPKWLQNKTHLTFQFEFASGAQWPEKLTDYALIIHCGGCMLSRREIRNRIQDAQQQQVPIVNYGLLIAHLQGVPIQSLP